jgi:hypothetical protein
MASKKKRLSPEELRRLARSAQDQVESLLKANQAGTHTRVQLQTGLKEVHESLKCIDLHFKWL